MLALRALQGGVRALATLPRVIRERQPIVAVVGSSVAANMKEEYKAFLAQHPEIIGSKFPYSRYPLHTIFEDSFQDPDSQLTEGYREATLRNVPFVVKGLPTSRSNRESSPFLLRAALRIAEILGLRPWRSHEEKVSPYFRVKANIMEPPSVGPINFHTDANTHGSEAPDVAALACVVNDADTPTIYIRAEDIWNKLSPCNQRVLTKVQFIFQNPYLKDSYPFSVFRMGVDGRPIMCFDADQRGLKIIDPAGHSRREIDEAYRNLIHIVYNNLQEDECIEHNPRPGSIAYYDNKRGVHGRPPIDSNKPRDLVRVHLEGVGTRLQQPNSAPLPTSLSRS